LSLLLLLDRSVIVVVSFQLSFPNSVRSSSSYSSFGTTPSVLSSQQKWNICPATILSMRSLSYDDLMERLPSKVVIDAIEQTPSRTVVASDIAATAGVSLSQARKDLTALASLSRGDIAVSDDGDLIYKFPKDLNSVLSSNSFKFESRRFLTETVWPPLFYLVRISFGLALLASIFIIFSTITVLTSSSSSDDRRGFGGGGFWGARPLDIFYYRPYYISYRDPKKMGFLESTFSYIFGDGNPNRNVEERQLRLLSDLIRNNKGVLTAEQIAPYVLDDVPSTPILNDDSSYVDESYVLPIVTQLDGEPRVTNDGDIVYLFPELQTSAQQSSDRQNLSRLGLKPDAPTTTIRNALIAYGVNKNVLANDSSRETVLAVLEDFTSSLDKDDDTTNDILEEREIKFSSATTSNLVLAGVLGVVNLYGALYLNDLLQYYDLDELFENLPEFYYDVVTDYLPGLVAYAVLYNAIPLVRSVWITVQNKQIQKRNERRQKWSDFNSDRFEQKLKQAKRMGIKQKILNFANPLNVFNTKSTSSYELNESKEKEDLKLFDRLLNQQE